MRRLAFCPVCGGEQLDRLASQVRSPEDALCVGRCAAAWAVLLVLRSSEASSALIADRRRRESEAHVAHAPVLSEILLQRWRSGDWSLEPDAVLGRLPPSA